MEFMINYIYKIKKYSLFIYESGKCYMEHGGEIDMKLQN